MATECYRLSPDDDAGRVGDVAARDVEAVLALTHRALFFVALAFVVSLATILLQAS
jgi:hypothetical protein